MQVWKKLGTALCAVMCIGAFSSVATAQIEWQELGRETLGSLIPRYSSFGFSVAAMGDINGDGLPDLAVGAAGGILNDENGIAHFICLDANGGYKSSKKIDYPTEFASDELAWFGASIAHVADVDVAGSEIKLVAVGAPRSGPPNSVRGAAFVYSMYANAGAASGDIVNAPLSFGDTANLKLIPGVSPVLGSGTSRHYGWSLAGLGDLDAGSASSGWGLAVGEPSFSGGGRVWIHQLAVAVDGKVSVTNTIEIKSSSGVFAVGDIAAGDDFGYSVAGVGDIDGDSVPDLAVGAPDDDDLGTNKGEVWILYMNTDGSVDRTDRLSSLLSGALAGKLGYALAAAGDVDGNGTPDLISSSQPAGEVVTFRLDYNSTAGLSLIGLDVLTAIDNCPVDCPDGAIDDFGCSVAVLPDFDNNGVNELIVGARDTSAPPHGFTGAIWLITNAGGFADCDGDEISDLNEIAAGAIDSNMNGLPDTCETSGSVCNGDGGDQLGCTDCPCMNNAIPGTVGGCLNSVGNSAQVGVTGDPSASLPPGVTTDLRFNLTGAPPGALCVMLSGNAIAPQNMANMCFGMDSGLQSFDRDGLRCAVMNTKRHGGRSANVTGEVQDSGGPSRVWGGEAQPNGGLWKQGGFVSGQTRFFQVTYRENALLGCMRGLNTSQAIEVVFTP